MKALYFDCFSGISGDMTLAALLDLGIDEAVFRNEMEKLNLKGYEIVISRKAKNGVYGMDVDVVLGDSHIEHDHQHYEHHHDHGHEHHHEHSHEHHHECDNEHHHEHHHDHDNEHHHEYHQHHCHKHHNESHHHSHQERNLIDIEKLIDESGIKQRAKDFSKKVFREIAAAEAKVHNSKIHEVHFHEVGAVDSIVDIVGVAVCLDLLDVQAVYSSPVHDGHGFIKCRHGNIPVPVPAVMEMLAGSKIPLVTVDTNTELVTPTGMGIIKTLSSGYGIMPAMKVEKVGYGMGKRETGSFNALRVVMGEMEDKKKDKGQVVILETNIDNMSSEILGYTMEKLFENGALDVFYTPIFMKKNRPAVLLSVLCSEEKSGIMSDIILKETTTLGIRKTWASRDCLDRSFAEVETGYGTVRVKIAEGKDFIKISPEFEDCAEIAKETGKPLREIFEIAIKKSGENDLKII